MILTGNLLLILVFKYALILLLMLRRYYKPLKLVLLNTYSLKFLVFPGKGQLPYLSM